MEFQIKDKDGKIVSASILDEQAAKLWNREVHPKFYAVPKGSGLQLNWFDCIGSMIYAPTTSQNYYSGWKEVKKNLVVLFLEGKIFEENSDKFNTSQFVAEYFDILLNEHLKPYLDLIDYWESLGYTPYHS